jgi:outer membrane protein OmpA-like peptidoglycan-associated protein
MIPSCLAVAAMAMLSFAPTSEAQIFDRLKKRAERVAEDEVGKKLESATRDAVRCALGDKACADKAQKDGKSAVFVDAKGNTVTDSNGKPITDADEAVRSEEAPGSGVWRNYDFVPGNTVWYALDLDSEPIGRFPAKQLEFVNGNMQIVERNGDRVLEISDHSKVRVMLPDTLPDDFTVEFEFKASQAHLPLVMTVGSNPRQSMSGFGSNYVSLAQNAGIAFKGAAVSGVKGLWQVKDRMMPFRIQVDGDAEQQMDYAIVYGGDERIAQMPNAHFGRARVLEFSINATRNLPAYLSNIVVAVHGTPLYDALRKEGEFTTRGILFDVDSDRLRPESTPTLTEIANTMRTHADLTIVVEGHTDAMGDEAHNKDLSERRARSVVDYLVHTGIERNRLTASGKGESAPVADNGTEVGRQQNRRVVLKTVGGK